MSDLLEGQMQVDFLENWVISRAASRGPTGAVPWTPCLTHVGQIMVTLSAVRMRSTFPARLY